MTTRASLAAFIVMARVGIALADQATEVTAKPSLGPKDSSERLCPPPAIDDDEEARARCGKPRPLRVSGKRGRFAELRQVDVDLYWNTELQIAFRIGTAWYLAPTGVRHGSRALVSGDHRIRSAKMRDVIPGGHPELVMEVEVRETHKVGAGMTLTTRTALVVVCGIGASDRPSCVNVLTALTSIDSEDKAASYQFRFDYRFDADGNLVRTLAGKWPTNPEVQHRRAELEGPRALRFP